MTGRGEAELPPVHQAQGAATKNVGLRGVTVADTAVSHVDGRAGRLLYRGYAIDVLAERSSYEEVAYLLIMGDMPTPGELEAFRAELGARRVLTAGEVDLLRAFCLDNRPMEVLQAVTAVLAAGDIAPAITTDKETERRRALGLTAKMASLTAAWHRVRQGLDPVPAEPGLGHAADFLRMLHAADPDPALARDMDVALILHADHSMNASTFVARSVTSTRAHIYAAVSAALGALSGELHGGANSRVMEMLEEIGDPEQAEPYVRARLEVGERIMGMGHAVYATDDPRAIILREMARRAGERVGDPRWYEITRRVQEATQRLFRERKGGEIYPNVDLYSASLYHVMGIPRDLFTPVFAVSRVAGWSAHVIEERFAEVQGKPQLYRPLSDYVGRYCGPESCEYVPLERRG
ncbi:MAG: citrate synthase [Thermoleophilia bacterium]